MMTADDFNRAVAEHLAIDQEHEEMEATIASYGLPFDVMYDWACRIYDDQTDAIASEAVPAMLRGICIGFTLGGSAEQRICACGRIVP